MLPHSNGFTPTAVTSLSHKSKAEIPVGVLLLAPGRGRGGTEVEVCTQVRHANRSKWSPVVISLTGDGQVFSRMGIPALGLRFLSFWRVMDFMRIVRRLSLVVQSQEIKIIHAFGFAASVFATIVSRRWGARVIVSVRNVHSWERLKNRMIFRIVLPSADAVLSNSEIGCRSILEQTRCRPERVRMISNHVEFSIEDREQRGGIRNDLQMEDYTIIGMIANIKMVKNPDLFLRVAFRICETHARSAFLLIGGGDRIEELKTQVRQRGLGDRIRLLGRVEDVHPFLQALDVLMLTSNSEGKPMSLLEGMSHGLPVVATRVGGIPELVEDGENGFLFQPGDEKAATEAVSQLVLDTELRHRMSESSKRKFDNDLNIEVIKRQMENLYDEVLAG